MNDSYQAEGLKNASEKRVHVPKRLRCIAVSSGKGGVGKTVVSIGLSFCLAQMNYRVLTFDADLGLANVDIQMGIEPKFTVQDVIFGNCSLEDAVVQVENGPDVLLSSSGSTELVDLGDARRQMFVDELVKFAAGYDFLIIDVAAGIGKNVTSFLSASPEVLMVVVNEPTSVMDAYSVVKVLLKSEDPPSIMSVMNMVRSLDEGEMLAERLAKVTKKFLGVDLPVAGVVTYDPCVGDAIRARSPLLRYAEKSEPAACLMDLARFVVSGRSYAGVGAKLNRNFFDKLMNLGMKQIEQEV